jgi:4-hydroxybenzoate polyprenyltransferase
MTTLSPKPEFAAPSTFDAATRLRGFAELLRIPNVFTAAADILLGFLFTHRELTPALQLALLLGSSALLYSAGMALNDYFDRQRDAHERPSRPIPSGRVAVSTARAVGFTLLAGGVALACAAAVSAGQPRPAIIATALAALIVLYDAALKSTPLAPLGMGGCRALNVLLGMSLLAGPLQTVNYLVAAGVGVYIGGVTWFARTEATESSRPALVGAIVVMMAGLGLLVAMPRWATVDYPLDIAAPDRWYLFWAVVAILTGWRCGLAVLAPEPAIVQSAVRNCIFSLIVIDAGACYAAQDSLHVILIAAMLAPTVLLGRYFYST